MHAVGDNVNSLQFSSRNIRSIVREYVLTLFFENPKTRLFTFFEAAFKKRKKRNPKFEVSVYADFSLHGISTASQKQCMFIVYMALVVA